MYIRRNMRGAYDDEPTLIQIIDTETRESIFMTKPWSYVAKDLDFRFSSFNVEESNDKHLLVLAAHYYDLEYTMQEELWGKTPQWFLDNKNQLAFYRTYDLENDDYTDWVGFRDKAFALYCPEFIMGIISKAWEVLGQIEIHRMEEYLVGLIEQNKIFQILYNNKGDDDAGFINLIANWYLVWNEICNKLLPYSFDKAKNDYTFLEKYYYYIRVLEIENRKRPETLKKVFPEGIPSDEFTEDNLRKVVSLHYNQPRKKVYYISDTSNNGDVDEETAIMSALKHGNGDAFGF